MSIDHQHLVHPSHLPASIVAHPAHWGRDVLSRESASLNRPIVRMPDGSLRMELYFDVHRFRPSEFTLSTRNDRLVLECEAQRRNEDGSFHSTQRMHREVALPAGVEKAHIRARVTPEGGLLVEAPCTLPIDHPTAKQLHGFEITHH